MECAGEGLDEVLFELYNALDRIAAPNKGTRGGNVELLGVALRIANPRARVSRSEDRGKPFSALGELLWYLSGSDTLEFIRQYVPRYEEDAEDGVLYGAYGPRLFSMRGGVDQISNVLRLLRARPTTRRAVIQLFNAEDIAAEHREIPCTTTIQLHGRGDLLHMSVTMRSNDAYWGLPHDIFCFTMIQEMMARALGLEVGEYYHYAGSMHVYDDYIGAMRQYVDEGHQRAIEMPPMPLGDPFSSIPILLMAEDRIRHGEEVSAGDLFEHPYWQDIVRLLQAYWAGGAGKLDSLQDELADPIYRSFIDGRRSFRPRQTLTRPS